MPLDSQAHPPRFRLWIRRQNVAEGAYSLRFEAQEGKGILRVARPGVLIDPPARPVGIEERLTPQQLRSTRFILVWDGGRARQGHLLNRIEEGQLERIELDRWLDMEIVVDGGFRYAALPIATPAAEARPSKAKTRRPSLSELRQALDSMTVHNEEHEDADSALASLTGPSQEGLPVLADAPRPGIAGRKPAAVGEPPPPPPPAPTPSPPPPPLVPPARAGRAVTNLADYEVVRPRAAPDATVSPRRVLPPPPPPPPGWQNDAPTVVLPKEDETAILSLGEADASVEDAESLALGEADGDLDEAETLELGGAPPPASEPPAQPTEPVRAAPPRAAPAEVAGGGAAAFFAQFSDVEDEAVFSVDLPSYRQSTEHVTVRRGDAEADGVFASEEVPRIRGLEVAPPPSQSESEALPSPEPASALEAPLALEPVPAPRGLGRSRSVHDLEDAIVELADPAAAPKPLAAPAPPSPGLAVDRWKNAVTLTPADDGDGIVHRSPTTLVRHLRRKVDEQRVRIAELESRIAELEGKG